MIMAKTRPDLLSALRANIPVGAKLLLAVSGGADSIALLAGCCRLRQDLQLQIEVVHLDHALRLESAEDAQFVARLSADSEVEFHLKRALPPTAGENIEAWGRRERYAFFEDVRKGRGLDWVVTAHHGDDQAETLLMKLLSNRELRTIEARDERRRLLRPLLTITKLEISDFISEHRLQFREDSSNSDLSFLRNRVRHNLIPLLRGEYEQAAVYNLIARAESLNEDLDCLEEVVGGVIEDLGGARFEDLEWARNLEQRLSALPQAIAWRVIEQLFLEKLRFKIGRPAALRALGVISGNHVAVELPGGARFRKLNGRFLIEGVVLS